MRPRQVRTAVVVAGALGLSTLTGQALPAPAQAAPVSPSYVPAPSWWGTNGRVSDLLVAGNRVYVAGGFDYVGPTTGHGVSVNAASGTMPSAAWPAVDGPVDASVPDGAGGWYLTGQFRTVGGYYRPGAAQVTSAGMVTAWNPKPTGRVLAVTTTPTSVVLAGELTALGPAPVSRLGAVDRAAGAPLASWTASADGPVRALVRTADGVYAGGDFTSVNGAARAGLARLDESTGAVDPRFAGQVRGSVRSMAVSGDGASLYVGGEFTTVSVGATSLTRTRLAGFGTVGGTPLAWAPAADGVVYALATDPVTGTVYAGGLFSTVAGAPRARLAGVTPLGAATAFNAALNGCHVRHTTGYAHSNPPCTPEVAALAARGGVLYVAGRFGRSGTVTRHDAAAYSLGTGALTAWNPTPGDRVTTIAPQGDSVFLGGDFTSVNGQVRKGVAALDATTGALDPTFSADTDNEVLDLAISSDGARLYLAGSFLTVRGLARTKLAAVSTTTGAVDPVFKPTFDDDVLSVGYAQGALFAAGQFTKVSGLSQRHVVKLSGSTGSVVPGFRADTVGPTGPLRAGGMVQSLVVTPDASKVFLAGPFLTVNGTSVAGGLAVVLGSTGALHPRQLGGVKGCSKVGPWMNRLYLSPDAKRLYGGDVCPDYIYQWDAVNLSSSTNPTGLLWRTWCNGGMQGALELQGRFYYGTHGNTCAAAPGSSIRLNRPRFAVFGAGNGVLQDDSPTFNSAMGIWAIGQTPSGLLLGGDFTLVNGTLRQGLAFIRFAG